MADALGLESGVVRLVEYDARWPALFAAERHRIHDHGGRPFLKLEHIGGTSIAGMCAKPIIDMAAGRPRAMSAEACVAALEQAGYEHRGERGVPGRQFFCRGEPRAYHLHLVPRASLAIARPTCTPSRRTSRTSSGWQEAWAEPTLTDLPGRRGHRCGTDPPAAYPAWRRPDPRDRAQELRPRSSCRPLGSGVARYDEGHGDGGRPDR